MFIMYMDLQTELAKEKQDKFQEDFKDLGVLDMEAPLS